VHRPRVTSVPLIGRRSSARERASAVINENLTDPIAGSAVTTATKRIYARETHRTLQLHLCNPTLELSELYDCQMSRAPSNTLSRDIPLLSSSSLSVSLSLSLSLSLFLSFSPLLRCRKVGGIIGVVGKLN